MIKRPFALASLSALLSAAVALAEPPPVAVTPAAAIDKGMAALVKLQEKDGHWGKGFPVAITAISGLAILASDEKALENERLWQAYDWMLKQQTNGDFKAEGHTWLHGQGFATLFMAELYGKCLLAKEPPKNVVLADLKKIIEQSVDLICHAQSAEGGWYYQRESGGQHEGSTTVCAVQALRAARNFGVKVPKQVLDKGFAYLKETQLADGGFEYLKGSGKSMVAGTAGALATLVLMSRLDEKVLINAMSFIKTQTIWGFVRDAFPDYGIFYATMAMQVIDEEYGTHKPEAKAMIPEILDVVINSQGPDGAWANKGWMGDHEGSAAYSTAFYVLTLSVPQGRLSIFHRDAPELPEEK